MRGQLYSSSDLHTETGSVTFLWSLARSTRPYIDLFEALFFEITTKNYNYSVSLGLDLASCELRSAEGDAKRHAP